MIYDITVTRSAKIMIRMQLDNIMINQDFHKRIIISKPLNIVYYFYPEIVYSCFHQNISQYSS